MKRRANAGSIYIETLKFSFMKFFVGIGMLLLSGLLLAVLAGIGAVIGEDIMTFMFIVWLALTAIIFYFIYRYACYIFKAGHTAVVAESAASGETPENQIDFSYGRVKDSFISQNEYHTLMSHIKSSVRQLQKSAERVSSAGKRKKTDFFTVITALSVSCFLGYIDACCLGYTLYSDYYGVYRSAADGVAVFFLNRKKLLRDSVSATAVSAVFFLILSVILYFMYRAFFTAISPASPMFLALLFCVYNAYVAKLAFIDTWYIIKTMTVFMAAVPRSALTYDLYGKLCGYSKKYKAMFARGRGETEEYQSRAMVRPLRRETAPSPPQNALPVLKAPAGHINSAPLRPVYCGECGSKNKPGAAVCINCGARLG